MQEKTNVAQGTTGASGDVAGPSVTADATVTVTSKKAMNLQGTVVGDISCSGEDDRCLVTYRSCRAFVQFYGDTSDCNSNGIYTTRGEPAEALNNPDLRESCWDLSSYGGLVRASGVESRFRNHNIDGLIAANPTLEQMCGAGASPGALENGVSVCLNPIVFNNCGIVRV